MVAVKRLLILPSGRIDPVELLLRFVWPVPPKLQLPRALLTWQIGELRHSSKKRHAAFSLTIALNWTLALTLPQEERRNALALMEIHGFLDQFNISK